MRCVAISATTTRSSACRSCGSTLISSGATRRSSTRRSLAATRLNAVALYHGPFLDGFRLPSAPEFERWADDERVALRHRMHTALEGLAHEAEQRGAHGDAASWWRRRAADDPLNARIAIALMHSLAAAGDRVGAIRHAGVFEALWPRSSSCRRIAKSSRSPSACAERRIRPQRRPHRMRPLAREALPPWHVPRRRARRRRSPCFRWRYSARTAYPKITTRGRRSWRRRSSARCCRCRRFASSSRTASFALGIDPGLTTLTQRARGFARDRGKPAEDGRRASCHLRLIETAEGHALSWERFDCALIDSHALQERIAVQFAERVQSVVAMKSGD